MINNKNKQPSYFVCNVGLIDNSKGYSDLILGGAGSSYRLDISHPQLQHPLSSPSTFRDCCILSDSDISILKQRGFIIEQLSGSYTTLMRAEDVLDNMWEAPGNDD